MSALFYVRHFFMRVFLHMLLSFILSMLICMLLYFVHQIWFNNILDDSNNYDLSLSSIGLYFIVVFSLIFIVSFSKFNLYSVSIIFILALLHFVSSLDTENVFEINYDGFSEFIWNNLLLKPSFILLFLFVFIINVFICLTFNKFKPRFFNEVV